MTTAGVFRAGALWELEKVESMQFLVIAKRSTILQNKYIIYVFNYLLTRKRFLYGWQFLASDRCVNRPANFPKLVQKPSIGCNVRDCKFSTTRRRILPEIQMSIVSGGEFSTMNGYFVLVVFWPLTLKLTLSSWEKINLRDLTKLHVLNVSISIITVL